MNLTKSHRSYFKAAKAVSELSEFKKHKIGVVAVYKHKVISSGVNSYVTNPLQKKYNQFRFTVDNTLHSKHAELDCLLPLLNRNDIEFSRVSLYIYRQHKSGALGVARPCESCLNLIKNLGIRDIYYTGDSSYIHEEIIY
jgi:deoxycytidylate deaminase